MLTLPPTPALSPVGGSQGQWQLQLIPRSRPTHGRPAPHSCGGGLNSVHLLRLTTSHEAPASSE